MQGLISCDGELYQGREICILHWLVSCCFNSFPKRTSSTPLSLCFVRITVIGMIKDVFPLPHHAKVSINQFNFANLFTLRTKMVSRRPFPMKSIKAASIKFLIGVVIPSFWSLYPTVNVSRFVSSTNYVTMRLLATSTAALMFFHELLHFSARYVVPGGSSTWLFVQTIYIQYLIVD